MTLLHLRHGWFFVIFLFCGALVTANLLHYVLFRLLKRKEAAGKEVGWGLQEHLGRPARLIFLLTCVLIALPFVPGLPEQIGGVIRQGVVMAIVAALGWFAVGLVYVFQAVLLRKYDLTAADNIRARRIQTQFQVLLRWSACAVKGV